MSSIIECLTGCIVALVTGFTLSEEELWLSSRITGFIEEPEAGFAALAVGLAFAAGLEALAEGLETLVAGLEGALGAGVWSEKPFDL